MKPRLRVQSGGHVRQFAASVEDRLVGSWSSSPQPINTWLFSGLRLLRARAREQIHNNDYASRFISLLKTNVVGSTGIQLQAQAKDNDKLDTKANKAIERAFRVFCHKKNIDFNQKLSFKNMLHQCVRTCASDGEFFLVKHTGRSLNEFGLAYEVIDPERCDITMNGELKNGHTVIMGIELDQQFRVVAYHFTARLHQLYGVHYENTNRIRVPADRVIHFYDQQSVEQLRGIPLLATPLLRLKMLYGYEEAALVNARVGATKSGFYTRTGDAADYVGHKDSTGAFVDHVEPGQMEILPEGWDFKQYNPDYPHNQYGEFTKTTLRGIASGLNVSYHALANDLEGVNFSSIRQGTLEDREFYKLLQEMLIDDVCSVIYDDFLRNALLRSKITLDSGQALPFSHIEKYSDVRWAARRWDWVDPKKDVEAKEKQNESFTMSKSEIIRERGRDPEEVWDEIERESRTIKKIQDLHSESIQSRDTATA